MDFTKGSVLYIKSKIHKVEDWKFLTMEIALLLGQIEISQQWDQQMKILRLKFPSSMKDNFLKECKMDSEPIFTQMVTNFQVVSNKEWFKAMELTISL